MNAKRNILGFLMLSSALSALASLPAFAASSWSSFKSNDVAFDYPASSGAPTAKKVKATPLANPDDKPDGVAPEHWELSFTKSAGKIWIIPAFEKGNKKFHDSYPTVDDAVKDLSAILQKKAQAPKEIPYLPWADWSSPFYAKVKYLNGKKANFVRFVALYQIEPDLISNDRLIYSAQGLTADGKHYMSVSIPVKAPFLTEKSDLPKWSKDKIEKFIANYANYTREQKGKLEKLTDTAYTPSLSDLDKLVQSISISK